MAAETKTGFTIDGNIYEVPDISSLNMNERRVMYDLSGLTQEQFVRREDETETEHEARVDVMTDHPGFIESLMHIAYQRGNPNVKRAKVDLIIGSVVFADAVSTLSAEAEEEEESPLALTSEPGQSSPSVSLVNESSSSPRPESSGSGSVKSSDRQDETPEATGISESGTSSISPLTSSAA